MQITHSNYMSQYRLNDTVPPAGPGYDIETLKRVALLDQNKKVEVFRLDIENKRGEHGHVFVTQADLEHAVKSLFSTAFTPSLTGTVKLTITV